MGPAAHLHHCGHLHLGCQVRIEDRAEVHALSSNGVHLSDGVTIGRMASIRPSGYYGTDLGHGLRIEAGSCVGAFSWIGAAGPVVIGRQVLLGPRVVILPENDTFEDLQRLIQEQGVERLSERIGNHYWSGADAIILAGVHIGRSSIVPPVRLQQRTWHRAYRRWRAGAHVECARCVCASQGQGGLIMDGPTKLILLLHPSAELYGADHTLLDLVTSLPNDGFEVQVALPRAGPLSEALRAKNIQVHIGPLGVIAMGDLNPLGVLKLRCRSHA